MNIPGLPEGVECVRIGRATPEDFEIVAIGGRNRITKNLRREDTIAQVIIRPAPGWIFQPVDDSVEVIAVKFFDHPVEITVTAKFSVTNSRDQQAVTDAADALSSLPGYVAP